MLYWKNDFLGGQNSPLDNNNINMNAILGLCRLAHTLYLLILLLSVYLFLWVVHHDSEPLIPFPCLTGNSQKNIAIHLL